LDGCAVRQLAEGALLVAESSRLRRKGAHHRCQPDAVEKVSGFHGSRLASFLLLVGHAVLPVTCGSRLGRPPGWPTRCACSVGVAGHLRAAAADQEVEIATLIGLQNMFDIEALIAAVPQQACRRCPG